VSALRVSAGPRQSTVPGAGGGPTGLCWWQRRVSGPRVSHPRTPPQSLRRQSTLTSLMVTDGNRLFGTESSCRQRTCSSSMDPHAALHHSTAHDRHSVPSRECRRCAGEWCRSMCGSIELVKVFSAHAEHEWTEIGVVAEPKTWEARHRAHRVLRRARTLSLMYTRQELTIRSHAAWTSWARIDRPDRCFSQQQHVRVPPTAVLVARASPSIWASRNYM